MKWGILATGTIARKFADTVNHMDPEAEKLIACASRNLLQKNTGFQRFMAVTGK